VAASRNSSLAPFGPRSRSRVRFRMRLRWANSISTFFRLSRKDPFTGTVFVFRAKRLDRLKLLYWDGSGLVMANKRLEELG
jgi:hypothetical protein